MKLLLFLVFIIPCLSLSGQTVDGPPLVIQMSLKEALPIGGVNSDSTLQYFQKALNYYWKEKKLAEFFAENKDFFRQVSTKSSKVAVNWLQSILDKYSETNSNASSGTNFEISYEIARAHFLGSERKECLRTIDGVALSEVVKVDSLLYADFLNLKGVTLRILEKYDLSIKAVKESLRIREEVLGETTGVVADSYSNLYAICWEAGHLEEALKYVKKYLEILNQLPEASPDDQAGALNNAGMMLKDMGRLNESISQYKKGIRLQEERGKVNILGNLHLNLGIAYRNNSALEEASDHYYKALTIFKGLRDSSEIANVYISLAVLLRQQGNFSEAIAHYEEALQIYERPGKKNESKLADVYTNLGVVHLLMNKQESSSNYFSKALEVYKSVGKRDKIANAYSNLGDLYFKMNDLTMSRAYQDSALQLQAVLFGDRNPALAYTYNKLAEIDLEEGNFQFALNNTQKALIANHSSFASLDTRQSPNADQYRQYEYYLESLWNKARIFRAMSGEDSEHLKVAQRQYQIADTMLTNLRNQLTTKEDKINLAKNVYRLSQLAVANLLQLADTYPGEGYAEQAFQFAEKSKASVLLQSITANNAKHFAGIPDTLIEREESLQSKINYYKLELESQPDHVQAGSWQNELFKARQAHKAIIEQLEQEFPSYYQLKYSNQVPTIADIQTVLENDRAIISYFTSDSSIYIYYLDADQYQVYRSVIDDAFDYELTAFYKGIGKQLDFVYLEVALPLYQKLFPFSIPDRIRELIIVPDGKLTTIPFEALMTAPIEDGTTMDKFPYLINDYVISYAPSVSLYQQLSRTSSSEPVIDGLLAFAPVFGDKTVINDQTRIYLEKITGNTERSVAKDGYNATLKGSAEEIKAISQVFEAESMKVQGYTFEDASEESFKRVLSDQPFRYLHIATHGFVNEDYPDLSGLIFYPPDTSSAEDGVLASGEVYNLKLNADLVALSACETGIGKITNGEGILGLSQSFLYAGARNLLLSLWKVDDLATAQLMTSFYGHHLSGDQPRAFNEALREAKLELIRSPQYARPYYWSAFVLSGK